MPSSSWRLQRVADPLLDAPDARPLRAGRRRDGAHEREHHERERERDEVERVRRGQADRGDEDAAERGPGDHPDVPAQRAERARGRKLVLLDEPRLERVERRPLDPVERGHRDPGDEEHPQARLAEERVDEQERRAAARPSSAICTRRRRSNASASAPPRNAVMRIGGSSAAASRPTVERGSGELVGLVRDGHPRDRRAEEREALAEEEQAEVAPPAQRPEVDRGQAAELRSRPGRARDGRRRAQPLRFAVLWIGHRGSIATFPRGPEPAVPRGTPHVAPLGGDPIGEMRTLSAHQTCRVSHGSGRTHATRTSDCVYRRAAATPILCSCGLVTLQRLRSSTSSADRSSNRPSRRLFLRLGCEVEEIVHHDDGASLVIVRDGIRTAVEVKARRPLRDARRFRRS